MTLGVGPPYNRPVKTKSNLHKPNPMSFASLKKQSSLGSLTAKLVKEVEKTNKGGGSGDDRLWKPEVDKAGNGYAVGGWYIENSLTTNGAKDPVSEYNSELWNTGIDSDKEIARKQKRKLSYYSNIYVVKDPSNPENEGKVFLYKYGKKIFDKVMSAMQPEFEDEEPINPFDFWAGADFKIKIKKVAGYWNYDSSEFARPGALLDDDEAMEAIWKKEYSLAEITAGDQFKSYDELKKRLDYVLGNKAQPKVDYETVEEESVSGFNDPDINPPAKQMTAQESEDDALSYFQKLAEE